MTFMFCIEYDGTGMPTHVLCFVLGSVPSSDGD